MITTFASRSIVYFISSISLLFFTLPLQSHPSIAIVKDSRGVFYYTDLDQVWKIFNGKKSIAVANVHTHELYVDSNDNLVGEHLWYAGDATGKFYHYLWRLDKDGRLDTLVKAVQAYQSVNYSLARDKGGNEYYCKFTDSMHLYKRNAAGKEWVFATHDFSSVKFFLPQANDDIFYAKQNTVYRILQDGEISIFAKNVGADNKAMLWGIWQDNNADLYVAVFHEGLIKKINKKGEVTDYYESDKGWAPAGGVFDNNNRLWVLEWSDKNEVRAILADRHTKTKKTMSMLLPVGTGLFLLLVFFAISFVQRQRRKI